MVIIAMLGIVLIVYSPWIIGLLVMQHIFTDPMTGECWECFLYLFPGLHVYALLAYAVASGGDWSGGIRSLALGITGKRYG